MAPVVEVEPTVQALVASLRGRDQQRDREVAELRAALARIEATVLMAVDLPVQAIREQIASGINLLVHLSRMQDGSRRVTHVTEIVGMQGGVISMHGIFEFQGRRVDSWGQILGHLQPTGLRPHLLDRLNRSAGTCASTI